MFVQNFDYEVEKMYVVHKKESNLTSLQQDLVSGIVPEAL